MPCCAIGCTLPAGSNKAYLRASGIAPILERQPNFAKEFLGYAESAFFGGRTSAHIRKVVVPVVYTDFLSMYPTVNSLMGLWRFVIARQIAVIKNCKAEIEEFLRSLTPEDLFRPATWKYFAGFVRVVPDGDVLPSRAKYSQQSNDWQVAVNHIYAASNNPNDGLWFSLPDVIFSVLRTGRVPKIVNAFRLEPQGTSPGLQRIKLRGAIEVDPGNEDFFRVVIQERKRLSKRTDLSDVEKARLDKALKVLANAASYGVAGISSGLRVGESCHLCPVWNIPAWSWAHSHITKVLSDSACLTGRDF